jgi:uncharacterized protein YjbI with pentapeptide repeats
MYIHPANFFPDENYRVASDSCFVIMPFSGPWCTGVYRAIRELVTAQGFHCRRADEYFDRVILSDIWRRINEAAFIIADLTDANPNVYYELGLAHSVGKDTISLIQHGQDVPFDQRSLRVIEYSFDGNDVLDLEPQLRESIASLEFNSSPQILLKRGLIQRFNEWKTAHRQIDLSNADLSDLAMSGVDFSGVILRGAYLRRADLSQAILTDVKLTSADLEGANMNGSIVIRGQISEANLTAVVARKANLNDSIIIRSNLTDLNASGCSLVRANLSESTLFNADLRNADLREGIWFRTRLDGANLTEARVAGLVVERATWRRYHHIFEAATDSAEIVIESD